MTYTFIDIFFISILYKGTVEDAYRDFDQQNHIDFIYM